MNNNNIKNKKDYLKDNKIKTSISESKLDMEDSDECNSDEDKLVAMIDDEIDDIGDNGDDLKINGSIPNEDVECDKENRMNSSEDEDISLLLELLRNTHINNNLSSDSELNFKLPLKERLKKKLIENKPRKRKRMHPKDSFSSEDLKKSDIKKKDG